MFEDYLQDSSEFLLRANELTQEGKERESRSFYRASAFYVWGAMEAFVNYIADSFAKANNIDPHEIAYLNDKIIQFSVRKGVTERTKYHPLDEKLRLLFKRFLPTFDYQSPEWDGFMQFKQVRDSLIHPRQIDDETTPKEYSKKISNGLKSIITLINAVSQSIFKQPLRKKLLDLIPD